MNEYIAFRTAHGIDDHTYKDLYLGDYFKIQDGTYNAEWMVAHFNYYLNIGSVSGSRGVVLIPRTPFSDNLAMGATHSSSGGYVGSYAYTNYCPAIATAISTVLGSYLLSINVGLTNRVEDTIPSMAGLGWNGASDHWDFYSVQCVLPTENQIFGACNVSSNFYDSGTECQKFAVFNFINQVEFDRSHFWMRAVVDSRSFAFAHATGVPSHYDAGNSLPIRPIIYIG